MLITTYPHPLVLHVCLYILYSQKNLVGELKYYNQNFLLAYIMCMVIRAKPPNLSLPICLSQQYGILPPSLIPPIFVAIFLTSIIYCNNI